MAAFSLVVREPGSPGTVAPAWFWLAEHPHWEGTVDGLPLGLQWRRGFVRFRGAVVVGRHDESARLTLRRKGREPLERAYHERFPVYDELPAVAAAIPALSPAVRELALGMSGASCPDYGPAGFEGMAADLGVLAAMVRAVLEAPDPPLLAAVKAGDREAVRARLEEGDDPNRPGPRDRAYGEGSWPRPETPLLEALDRGDLPVLRLLAPRAAPTWDVWDVFALAAGKRRLDLVDALLGDEEAPRGPAILSCALRQAAGRGWAEGVRHLLAKGASPLHAEAPEGETGAEIRELLARATAEFLGEGGPIHAAEVDEARPRHALGRLGAWLPGSRARARRAWEAAGRELGLARVDAPSGLLALAGSVESLDVRVEAVREAASLLTRVSVGGLPEWLSLRRETLREKLGLTTERFIEPSASTQWARVNDVLTRDHEFDRRIDVRGPIPDCLALLSHDVRRMVLGFVDRLGGTVDRGRVRIERRGLLADAGRLTRLVRASLELARALAGRQARGALACLFENATTDPSESIRAGMLGALGDRFPGSPQTLEASRLALKVATYDWYRMVGATHLDQEGTAAFRAILGDTMQQPAVRGMALRHLGFRAVPDAEELALSHLGDPSPEIVLHAVRVLGERCGTARAVEPLQRAVGEAPSRQVSRAAVAAVEQIQSRLRNAAPGQLALAEPAQSGELSLTGAAGAVSLAGDEGPAQRERDERRRD